MVTTEFIESHKGFLLASYRKKSQLLTTEDLEDLVQDTFEKVTLYQDYFLCDFKPKSVLNDKDCIRSWLSLLTLHVYDRFKRGSLQITEIAKDYTKDDLLEDVNDYFYSSNKEEVDSFINLLPELQRNIVYLKLILGHTHPEIASKLRINVFKSQTVFSRGMKNLKKLINSDNPKEEVLEEVRILKPYGDKPFAGEWWWRYGESEFQKNGKCYVYTNEEVVTYCNDNNLEYNLKERT